VPMTVVNALLLSVASKEQEKTMHMLDKLDSLRGQLLALYKTDDLL